MSSQGGPRPVRKIFINVTKVDSDSGFATARSHARPGAVLNRETAELRLRLLRRSKRGRAVPTPQMNMIRARSLQSRARELRARKGYTVSSTPVTPASRLRRGVAIDPAILSITTEKRCVLPGSFVTNKFSLSVRAHELLPLLLNCRVAQVHPRFDKCRPCTRDLRTASSAMRPAHDPEKRFDTGRELAAKTVSIPPGRISVEVSKDGKKMKTAEEEESSGSLLSPW